MTNSTLKTPLKVETYSTKKSISLDSKETTKDLSEGHDVNIVFLPSVVTPLSQYEAELRKAGHSEKLIKDIIDGLAYSPLHEGKTS